MGRQEGTLEGAQVFNNSMNDGVLVWSPELNDVCSQEPGIFFIIVWLVRSQLFGRADPRSVDMRERYGICA